MSELQRIGERKHYIGIFAVCKTDNVLKYLLRSDWNQKSVQNYKPVAYIDDMGIYVGDGRFTVFGSKYFEGDVFYETPIVGKVLIEMNVKDVKNWVGTQATS